MLNKVKFPSVTQKTVTVNSFSNGYLNGVNKKLAGLNSCVKSYNFNYQDGSLKSGVYYSDLSSFDLSALNTAVPLRIYFYPHFNNRTSMRDDRVLIYADDGFLYSAEMRGAFKRVGSTQFFTAPEAIPYDYLDSDVMLISYDGGLYVLNDTELTMVEDAPPITSLTVHSERLFVTVMGEGTSLWFSDDFNPTNWVISLDEAGFIDFSDNRGKLLKVVSFLGSVYAFREYGITRITAYGDQTEFSVDHLFCSQGKIIGSSITDCGDFIVMLTSAGFFKFNGVDAVKILGEYDNLLKGANNQTCKGVFHNNTVYFKVNLIIDGVVENCLICYDVIKKSSYIAVGLEIEDICFIGRNVNEVAIIKQNKVGVYKLQENSLNTLEKVWLSPEFNFDIPGKNKRLSCISLYTKTPVTLTVFADNISHYYELQGGGVCKVKPYLKGEYFSFEIKTNHPEPEILDLTVSIEYIRGENNAN